MVPRLGRERQEIEWATLSQIARVAFRPGQHDPDRAWSMMSRRPLRGTRDAASRSDGAMARAATNEHNPQSFRTSSEEPSQAPRKLALDLHRHQLWRDDWMATGIDPPPVP